MRRRILLPREVFVYFAYYLLLFFMITRALLHLFPGILLLAWSISLSPTSGADEVSRKAPALYTEHIAPLFTPLEKVLKGRDKWPKDNEGVVLLNESMQWVTPEGHRLIAEHSISIATTEAGAAALAEYSEYYKKAITTPHVVLARTILPDGIKIDVDSKGTLLHSPQPDADMALYGDVGELRIVFPGVKPGCIVERTIVMDQSELAIPGELMTETIWGDRWPTLVRRWMVDAPEAMASRVHVTTLGVGEPALTKTSSEKGRLRLSWEGTDLATLTPEPDQPSWTQTGPMVAITTLDDWNGVTRWFAKLTGDRSTLPAASGKEIDENLPSSPPADDGARKALLEALFKKVADDVRYTGLEFGMGAYQPRDPGQVWGTRYGDCKDKSNLLRVLLARHGVNSWLALVNVQHDGRVARECPTVHRFGHVVLAVDDGHGGYIWCDPTMTHASPGQLSAGVSDRDVLLVKEDKAEWVHTKPAESDLIAYEAELKPRPEGGWTGWLRMRGEGLTGSTFNTYFEKSDRPRALAMLRSISEGMVPHAELLDFQKEDPPTGSKSSVKMFIDVPGVPGRPPEARAPQSRWEEAFTRLNKRHTDFFQQLEKRKIQVRYVMPKGASPIQLPGPLKLNTDCFKASAEWENHDGVLTSSISWETIASVVRPDSYVDSHTAAQTLASWVDRPVELQSSSSGNTEPAAIDDLPVMPTAEGQLALIDRRYPTGGDINLRRRALLRVAELFPNESNAVFGAEIELSKLEMQEHHYTAAAGRLQEVMQRLGGRVGAEMMGWARTELGLALKLDGKTKESAVHFDRVYADEQVSRERRAWCGLMLADAVSAKEPKRAVAVLKQSLGWQTQSQALIFNRLSRLLVDQGDTKEFLQVMKELYARGGAQVQAAFADLGAGVEEYLAQGKPDLAARWLDALAEGTPKAAQSLVANSITNARGQIRIAGSGDVIREKVREALDGGLLPGWDQQEAGYPIDTLLEVTQSFSQLAEAGRTLEALHYGLRRLSRFDADQSMPYVLLKSVQLAYEVRFRFENGQKIVQLLVDMCKMLPRNHPAFLEGKLWQATLLNETDAEGAEKVLQEILASPNLSHEVQVRANATLGRVYQRTNRDEEALKVYESLLPYAATNYSAFDASIHAVMLQVIRGHYDRACDIAVSLNKPFEKFRKYIEAADSVQSLLNLTANRAEAVAYWESAKEWWPEWQKFEQAAEVNTQGVSSVALLTTPRSMGQSIGYAVGRGDVKGGFRLLGMVVRSGRVFPMWEEVLLGMPIALQSRLKENEGKFLSTLCVIAQKVRLPKAMIQDHIPLTVYLLAASHHAEEACAEAEQFWPQLDLKSAGTAAVARVWATAALQAKKDLEAPKKALLATLQQEANPHGIERAKAVFVLSSVLFEQKQFAEGIKLVTRELDHPDVKNSKDATALRDRLRFLSDNTGADPGQFVDAIKTWIAAQPRLAWLELAEPKTVAQSEIESIAKMDASQMVKKSVTNDVRFDTTAIKRTYEAFLSPDSDIRTKQALIGVLMPSLELCAGAPARDISPWLETAIRNEHIPMRIRAALLHTHVYDAAMSGDIRTMRRYQKDPLIEWLETNVGEFAGPGVWERYLAVYQCDITSLDSVKEVTAKLSSHPDDRKNRLTPWDRLLARIFLSGTDETARWMVENPGISSFGKEVKDDSVRELNLLKGKKTFEAQKKWINELLNILARPLGQQPRKLERPECLNTLDRKDPDVTSYPRLGAVSSSGSICHGATP